MVAGAGVDAVFVGAADLRAGALAKTGSFAFSRYGKASYRRAAPHLATPTMAGGEADLRMQEKPSILPDSSFPRKREPSHTTFDTQTNVGVKSH
ncbi:protein of unknown function [uncultured Sphingopyxis sp.]|uniref:Uncharacterized protein n=1 Tax=uncultured Sphingopyxis sp. TaxID=310581 RepID=A0A1Y5PXJ7_9SPHN|nr:protein of unknown function [uncultured Sphingopyxis sp.]